MSNSIVDRTMPVGWWYRNQTHTVVGPQAAPEPESDESDNEVNELDIEPDSDGWEDQEDDVEAVSIQCLLCPEIFPSILDWNAHSQRVHNFNLSDSIKAHHLDFYGTIRYINYIRKMVKDDHPDPTEIRDQNALKESEELLKPVLENDALLFLVDEIFPFDEQMEDVNGETEDGKLES